FTTPTGLTLTGGGGAVNTTNINIVPYAIGDTSSTGTGIGLVTYNIDANGNANGIRPLSQATEYATTPAAGRNVMLTASRSANDNIAVNALVLKNSGTGIVYDFSPGGASTLTVTSGYVISLGSVANSIAPSAAGTLAFGATEAKFFVGSGADLTL